ncbi:hypothetical protein [Thioalkalivibrio sp. ALE12]|uniref:hypothetical protein n=1 Tax=Thioalkalivibrio sp. ALE12 TaxID=1158170 RepID=UPI00036FE4CF|nr:hypothetical protein [Thioalkalivibrio sp. ALE12]
MPMENLTDTNIWEAFVKHTPAPIRYLFGALSLGVITLAASRWRAQTQRIDRLEYKIDQAAREQAEQARELHQRIDRSNSEVTQRLDEVNTHLLDIARNTHRRPSE